MNPMTIPDFQAIMLPLLSLVSNGEEYRFRDLVEPISNHFGLSDEEKAESIPSGPQPKITNRVGWAATHLSKAGLTERPRHGYLKITERGLSLLEEGPDRIDLKLLDRYPEHLSFRSGKKDRTSSPPQGHPEPVEETRTPSEIMGDAYRDVRSGLAEEILQQVKSCSPGFFERLVVDLLVSMGYGGTRADAGEVIGRSGDGGIDGTIKEDRLGLDVIYVQAKRWENTVGRPDIQQFAGALQGQKARKGVFITTSGFSKAALDYARDIESSLVLVDGEELAGLMIDHDIGVTVETSFEIKRMDSDYFEEA